MGYGALVSATAPALGLTYGGIVNQTLGWRYIFVLLVPVLIITLILIRLCSLQELQEPVFVRHWWQQRRCRIILSAMSKKRQQKNVICRYQLFNIEQKFTKKLDYCKVGILHESVLFDKRFLLLQRHFCHWKIGCFMIIWNGKEKSEHFTGRYRYLHRKV